MPWKEVEKGKFRVWVEVPGGKRQRRYKTVYGRQTDARTMERHLEDKYCRGVIPDGRITFKDIALRFIEEYLALELAHFSRVNYTRYLKKCLIPVLGHMRIEDIQAHHISPILNNLAKEGYAKASVRYCRAVASSVFRFAIGDGLLSKNPVRDVVVRGGKKDKEITVFTRDQMDALLSGSDGWLNNYIYLVYHTGMRNGEALTLTWDHIDNGYIRLKAENTKSRRSRDIPIVPVLKTKLKEIKKEQAQHRLYYAGGYQNGNLVICHPDGRPIAREYTWERVTIICRRLGFKGNPHKLRHTFASFLFDRGCDLKVISYLLGHSNIGVTANVYTHMLTQRKEAARDMMETALNNYGDKMATKAQGGNETPHR